MRPQRKASLKLKDFIRHGKLMLDVHIADSYDAASKTEAAFQIDFDTHSTFFAEREKLAESSPLLARLSDYFADCEYKPSKLPALIAEIDAIVEKLLDRNPHKTMLLEIRKVCQAAIDSSQSVFFLCD